MPVSQGGTFVEPPQSMRQEKELDALNKSVALNEVLSTNIQVPLSAILACVPNLKTDLIAWLENEIEIPQDEFWYVLSRKVQITKK